MCHSIEFIAEWRLFIIEKRVLSYALYFLREGDQMKKLWLLLPLLLLLSACGTAKETSSKQEIKDLKKVTLVLDYVPNTNHTGIYLAKEKGYYKEAGLNVQIIEPGDNSTSIGLVGADKAQFGVSYQEDVTYAHADGQNIPVKAIATVIKHNPLLVLH